MEFDKVINSIAAYTLGDSLRLVFNWFLKANLLSYLRNDSMSFQEI